MVFVCRNIYRRSRWSTDAQRAILGTSRREQPELRVGHKQNSPIVTWASSCGVTAQKMGAAGSARAARALGYAR